MQDRSQDFSTAICCVCADGSSLDSEIIFKSQNLQDSWFTDAAGVQKDFLFGVSPNKWTGGLRALACLGRLFGPGSASERKATNDTDGSRRWRLFVLDGHISQANKTFLYRCLDYQVLPVCLPPHTTHFLQPLDVPVRYTSGVRLPYEGSRQGYGRGYAAFTTPHRRS